MDGAVVIAYGSSSKDFRILTAGTVDGAPHIYESSKLITIPGASTFPLDIHVQQVGLGSQRWASVIDEAARPVSRWRITSGRTMIYYC